MRGIEIVAIALKRIMLGFLLGMAWQAIAQDAKTPYPNMAPVEQYLMEPSAEIALARSAAPESISRDAEVMVLGRHGYETSVQGKNGFVCMVERSWTSPIDDPVSGIQRGELRSASMRLPRAPTFREPSRRRTCFLPDKPNLR